MLPATLYTGAMPLEPAHLRRHLIELRDRVRFLRALEPDAPAYRLWLGDVIQLVNEQYGLNSPQMQQLRAVVVLLALGLTRTTRAQTGRQPNDPLYARQSYLLAIHAPEAWTITIGDPGVIIAVVDSGIDLTHPDLAPNLRANPNAGLAGCGDDAHGCDVLDPARAARSCGQLPAAPSADVAPLTPRGTFLV